MAVAYCMQLNSKSAVTWNAFPHKPQEKTLSQAEKPGVLCGFYMVKVNAVKIFNWLITI